MRVAQALSQRARLVVLMAFVAACAALPVASASALGLAAPGHPLIYAPDPLAVARYLSAQRAGLGGARAAALRVAGAQRRAMQLRASAAARTSSMHPSAVSGTWASLGPAPIRESFYGGAASGRVNAIAVTPSGEIFIGAAGGGIWSSSDGGSTWVTHTDQVSSGLAIGALALDPTNPQIIYAGTGDANNCGDCFYGGGVLKSTNGGATWTVINPGGQFTGVDFTGLAVDPSNPQHLLAATTSGLFESSDAGASWTQATGSGDLTDAASAVMIDPAHPATVYLATPGLGIQESTDGGASFTTLGGGLPAAAAFGVTALAMGTSTAGNPAADQTLYAAVALNGVTDPNNGGGLSMYKSTDAGASWSLLTAVPAYTNQSYAFGTGSADQASYDNTLAVDPTDPQHVIAGGIAAIESTDGGASWVPLNGQSFFGPGENVMHPDFHAAVFAASGLVLLGSDAGVFGYTHSSPARDGVTNLNGDLDIAQAYQGLGVSSSGTAILAGLQSTGSVLYNGSRTWTDEVSGDGGYSAINPLDTNQQFIESDGRIGLTTDNWAGVTADITPPGEPDSATNFLPPMTLVANPAAPDSPTVYYGGADLLATTDPASATPTWTRLTAVGSGVSAIAAAPSDPAVVYVGFDDGTLEVSTNATSSTPTFTAISPGVSEWITHIAVDPSNPARVALTFSSSNTHSFAVPPMVLTGSVLLSGTPTAAFTDQTGNLPSGVASNSVVFDGSDLVLASDVGVFRTPLAALSATATSWVPAGSGLPNVQVIGLTLDAAGNLYAATHGRGVWKLAGPNSPSAPVQITAPSLSGSPAMGRTMSEGHGTWTANPTSYLYQWLRCSAGAGCAPIPGATAQNYTVSAADAGDTLEVQETAVNPSGASLPATSVPSAIVPAAVPVLFRPPAISGTARVGSTLFAVGALWTQNPSAFAFQWWRCSTVSCTAIPGATWEAYTLVSADRGALIKVSETAANAGGTSPAATSSAVGPVAAAPTPPPPPTRPPTPPPGGKGPSQAKVRLALHSVISAPPGRLRGRPAALTVPFAAPGAGRLTVAWTVRVAQAGRKPLTIATLRVSITRAGHLRLRLALTARGKALLTHSRRVWVLAAGSFTPKGRTAIRASQGFWLSR